MTRRPVQFVIGLVAGSHVVNHAYMLLFAPAFPLLRAEFGVSLAAVGLSLGVVNMAVTAGQLPLGYVSDTYSHTAVLVGSLVVGTVGCVLAAIAPTYEWLVASAVVIGLGVSGHHPAHYPLIAAATTDEYRSRAYSIHGFAGALGLALPFAVVSAAVAIGLGWRAAVAAVAALGLVYTLLTVLAVRRIPRSISHAGADARAADETGSSDEETLSGRLGSYGRTLVSSPLVLLLTALWFVNSVSIWGIRTYAATLLDLGYGLSAGAANTVVTAMLVIGAVVLLGGGYLADRVGPMAMLFVGYSALVALTTVVGIGRLPVLAAVAAVSLLAATVDLSRPARATLTDLASQRTDVGKNFALITLGISAGGVVAPPVFGYVIETVGVGAAFVAIAAVAASALGLSVSIARLRSA
ncbi:MAG: MFS transporter [Natronomonas sp.]|uniref:MFS transporter n=1 Tax=Natronomonas sp. TaxID=2184060 RepID=UPI002870277F|nr:MFS transporter [Natronomonas sp.]MDR9381685.1 MFS transporter [Natronomonas sp.]MDR9429518.1 MFS transporter [Natronomonas sp.]